MPLCLIHSKCSVSAHYYCSRTDYYLWMLPQKVMIYLSINLSDSQAAQIFHRPLLWVCLLGCFCISNILMNNLNKSYCPSWWEWPSSSYLNSWQNKLMDHLLNKKKMPWVPLTRGYNFFFSFSWTPSEISILSGLPYWPLDIATSSALLCLQLASAHLQAYEPPWWPLPFLAFLSHSLTHTCTDKASTSTSQGATTQLSFL